MGEEWGNTTVTGRQIRTLNSLTIVELDNLAGYDWHVLPCDFCGRLAN